MHCGNNTLEDHPLLCRSQTLTNKDDDNIFNLFPVFVLSYFRIGLVFANGNWDAACLVGGKQDNMELNLVT